MANKDEENVLASLNNRTLVNGTFVATAPIGSELGLSADELERSLASLAARGLIVRNAAGGATISPEGHANAIT